MTEEVFNYIMTEYKGRTFPKYKPRICPSCKKLEEEIKNMKHRFRSFRRLTRKDRIRIINETTDRRLKEEKRLKERTVNPPVMEKDLREGDWIGGNPYSTHEDLLERLRILEAKVRETELRIEELYIYTGQQERMKTLKAFEEYKKQRQTDG